MLTLGLSGGLDLVDQNRDYLFPPGSFHDGAAVLVHDGKVVAAVEEERLNRIKHSSKGAVSAIRFCLERHGARLSDVDALAVYVEEQFFNQSIRGVYANVIHAAPVTPPRKLVHELLERGLGTDIDDRKLVFVRHHLAHALGAYVQSGFDDSLVLTIDGAGDWESGTVAHAASGSLQVVQTFSNAESLGVFYSTVGSFLGFGGFEEYKVMGLAPYGDPRKYRRLFQSLYQLHPYGNYAIRWDRFDALSDIGAPRKKNEPVTEFHQNVAAALQEALEQIVGHVLAYYRWLTGHRRLCMAGGVAHNCSLNGKILYSGLFDDIFVHPASHDAGCAIGAAFYPFATELGSWHVPVHGTAVRINGPVRSSRLEHVYLGARHWNARGDSDGARRVGGSSRIRTSGRYRRAHRPPARRRPCCRLGAGLVGIRTARSRKSQHPRRPASGGEPRAHQPHGEEARGFQAVRPGRARGVRRRVFRASTEAAPATIHDFCCEGSAGEEVASWRHHSCRRLRSRSDRLEEHERQILGAD